MNVDFNPGKTSFNAKVSERFVNSMRGYVNSGSNRLKNNYMLNAKLEEYATFGFDDYTVELQKKSAPLGVEYILSAIKDGEKEDKRIILGIKDSYRQIFKRFMTYNKREFRAKINAGSR